MPAPKPNRLAGLVKTAADEISPPPIRRGRGLDGVISAPPDPPLAASPQADMSTSPQADMSTSPQADMSTSPQADMSTSVPAGQTDGAAAPSRTVKSYRLRDDLVYKIDLLAATDRRKIYEIVEEALELYLLTRAEDQARTGAEDRT